MSSEPQIMTPLTPDALLRQLDALNIAHITRDHDAAFTVAQAQAHRGDIAGLHCKNLFLRDKKKNLFLVVAEEDQAVDLKALRAVIGAKGTLSFGSAQLLHDTLGVTPGSVTPLAVIHDAPGHVRMVIEARLAAADAVSFHPLINTRTTTISGSGLVQFLEWSGHAPLILSLP